MVVEVKQMEIKKSNHQTTAPVDHAVLNKKSRDFAGEIKQEIKNVTWTSKDELITYTQIVVGATFIMGMGIYFVDLAIQLTLQALTWFTRLIAG